MGQLACIKSHAKKNRVTFQSVWPTYSFMDLVSHSSKHWCHSENWPFENRYQQTK